jgi:hypothetical protein
MVVGAVVELVPPVGLVPHHNKELPALAVAVSGVAISFLTICNRCKPQ